MTPLTYGKSNPGLPREGPTL